MHWCDTTRQDLFLTPLSHRTRTLLDRVLKRAEHTRSRSSSAISYFILLARKNETGGGNRNGIKLSN